MATTETTALLGALVATQNLTLDDAQKHLTFLDFVDEVNVDVPDIYAAIDLALDFYHDDPDAESEAFAERVQAAHNHDGDVCPDCGGEMMDEVDYSQAIDLWVAVRMITDKYQFDQSFDGREEC